MDPEEQYQKVHDLYSLRVVLLEIAWWGPWEGSVEVLRGMGGGTPREELIGIVERVAVVVGERYARVMRCLVAGDGSEGGGVRDEVKYVLGGVGSSSEVGVGGNGTVVCTSLHALTFVLC